MRIAERSAAAMHNQMIPYRPTVRPPAKQYRLAEPGCRAFTHGGHVGRVGEFSGVFALLWWPCWRPSWHLIGYPGKPRGDRRAQEPRFVPPSRQIIPRPLTSDL